MFRASSLGDLFEMFQARWNPIFDFTYLKSSNTWIDIGKETIYDVQWQDLRPDNIPEVDHNRDTAYSSNAASYASSEADETEARQPYTYLWRNSYLDQVYTRFKMGVLRDGFRRNIYPFSLLDEACSMTLEPGKTHRLKLVGLIYSQYYSSTKEIFDVSKVYPWDNDSLEGLAIDPLLHEFNCVVPYGDWEGGDLLLWEPRQRIQFRQGQAIFFRAASITHNAWNIQGRRNFQNTF